MNRRNSRRRMRALAMMVLVVAAVASIGQIKMNGQATDPQPTPVAAEGAGDKTFRGVAVLRNVPLEQRVLLGHLLKSKDVHLLLAHELRESEAQVDRERALELIGDARAYPLQPAESDCVAIELPGCRSGMEAEILVTQIGRILSDKSKVQVLSQNESHRMAIQDEINTVRANLQDVRRQMGAIRREGLPLDVQEEFLREELRHAKQWSYKLLREMAALEARIEQAKSGAETRAATQPTENSVSPRDRLERRLASVRAQLHRSSTLIEEAKHELGELCGHSRELKRLKEHANLLQRRRNELEDRLWRLTLRARQAGETLAELAVVYAEPEKSKRK